MTGNQLLVSAVDGVLANDTDENGDVLSARLGENVSNGTLALSDDGSFTYTPADDFIGTDTFTYFADDSVGSSLEPATVTLTVEEDPENPPVENLTPIAVDDSVTTEYETAVDIPILLNDIDESLETLDVVVVSDSVNGGVLVNVDNTVTYTPNVGFAGTDQFSYTIDDGVNNPSAAATVTVEILPESNVAPDPDLLVHLRLNDSQTPAVASDSSANGNFGVITGATYVTDTGDGSITSLEFDGADSVDLGAVDAEGTGLTLAAWFRADSFPGGNRDPRIISKTRNISSNSHVFMLSTTRRGSSDDTVLQGRVRIRGKTTTFRSNTGILETGVWYHAAMVYDQSTMKLYLNGEEVLSRALFGPLDTDESAAVVVGASPSGGFNWDGGIDEVLIAQRPYSAAEVQTLAGQ